MTIPLKAPGLNSHAFDPVRPTIDDLVNAARELLVLEQTDDWQLDSVVPLLGVGKVALVVFAIGVLPQHTINYVANTLARNHLPAAVLLSMFVVPREHMNVVEAAWRVSGAEGVAALVEHWNKVGLPS